MLRHKHIDRICCIVLALTVLIAGVYVGAAGAGVIGLNTSMGYETRLFDQSRVHTIDIVMDDWESFLTTCTSEVYAPCDVTIDGEKYANVAIRGKGNTSLSSVRSYGNDRYSFKIEFDRYQSGMTYHGLDKLSLNNLIQDNTYMKDYWAYTLMNKMGVASSLCSFVQINVNGEPWGLYLAVEGVEDAFLQRNYGQNHGELYKPDAMSMGGGRGNGGDFSMDNFTFDENTQTDNNGGFPAAPDGGERPEAQDMGDFGGSFGGSSGRSSDSGQDNASDGSSRNSATAEPTATPAPTVTAAPSMPGESGGGAAQSSGAATGDAEQSSGAPAMPDNGQMPDMGDFAASGGTSAALETSDAPGAEIPQMPGNGQMPDMGDFAASGGTSAAPETSDAPGAEIPQMPGNGQMPDMPTGNFDFGSFDASNRPEAPDGGTFEMPGGGGFGGFGGFSSGDVKLQYSDDNPSSYSNIFNNAKTDITEADQTRLIASLKALSEGDTSVVDTSAVIRYMAVHNFLCNDDSYTGMMVHNYYLYEENGVMSMIPWDYNLGFGGFSASSNGTSAVNTSITSLVSGMGGGSSSGSDRPMAAWIMSNEEYKAEYLAFYQQFIDEVFASGWFEEEFERVSAMIDEYVKNDREPFCTYEEFQTASEILKEFCLRRAKSAQNQLNGDNTRVDASDLNITLMGSMNGGGGFGGGRDEERSSDRTGKSTAAPTSSTPQRTEQTDRTTQTERPSSATTTERPSSATSTERSRSTGDFTMPGMSASRGGLSAVSAESWQWLGGCAALLALAIIFALSRKSNR